MSGADKAFQRAVAAFNQRNFQDAEKQFRRVLEREPRHAGALNLMTIALMSLGRFADAEKTIARAVQVTPNSDVSFYNYGTISKHLGKPEQALAQFTLRSLIW